MQRMKFLNLSLLSQKEQRGFQLDLNHPKMVLVAGNGFGKSAILKSLYDTFGAKPHKIDKAWLDAKVISLVEFSVDSKKFAIMKSGATHTLFDDNRNVLLTTNQVVSTLGPSLAAILDFHLVLSDKKEQIKIPPPSFAFAPFYVDQDSSWQKVWSSFKDLTMFSNSGKSLAEYHSGLRPNAYYQAKAARDALNLQLSVLDSERNGLHKALEKIRESAKGARLSLSMDDFVQESERLVREGQILHTEQSRYRSELASLNEEHQLWSEHVALIESALSENDASFAAALEQPSEVECPMCGQHYHNKISDQFEIVADTDDLLISLQSGRARLREIHAELALRRRGVSDIEKSLARLNDALSVHREDISLRDVVAAEGRSEAERYLKIRLNELDAEYGDKTRAVAENERLMKLSESRTRSNEIRGYFSQRLKAFAERLDVRLDDSGKLSLQGLNIGRGSEGPRALACYYFAFLHTVSKYSTSTFCPIVMDAPNQQGQDPVHLKAIMSFLLAESPPNSQIIIGAEAISDEEDTVVVNIENQKDRVLQESMYDSASEHIRPFLQQSILS